MKFKLSFLLLNLSIISLYAQDLKSEGDRYFFQYKYEQAAEEYAKESLETVLTTKQFLNYAESYFNTDQHQKAWDTYKMIQESDAVLPPFHYNKMLRSLYIISGKQKMNKFLENDTILKEAAWAENAKFNFDIANTDDIIIPNYNIFNVKGNSISADFSPSFYKDKLLFTSDRRVTIEKKRKKPERVYLNIYESEIEEDGDITNVIPSTVIPSSKFHQATPYYSSELDKIFYVLSNEKDNEMLFDETGKNALSIAKVDRNSNFNFILKNLSTSFFYPFYDEASQRLYFVANFDDGYGGTDIYYVNTNQGQIMSAPINLGPRVNTPGNEISPFVFENGLYFSSDVFYGYGGMDIYKSNLKADGAVGVPINLGEGINSTEDDFGFIVKNNATGGLEGYFSSNREGGKGKDDIYGFKVAEKPKLNTIVLQGATLNPNTNIRIGGVTIKVYGKENSLIKEIVSAEDGSYEIELPWQEKVTVIASKKLHSLYRQYFIADDLKKKGQTDIYLESAADFVVEKEGKAMLKLNKFTFNTKSSKLTSAIKTELDKAIKVIKKFPEFNLQIESHTDSKGGSSSNFRVSQGRADAIKKYLIDNGVQSRRILYTIGYGEDHILNKCANGVYCIDYFHAENRRCNIVILNYKELY
ncbi:OmpA family protein [Cellulophaga fucicola]|uniref:WD40-like Beta Propeller Repeat n=1 Tax=Cellulophaga fucicola TaxID=76595 RepID=A0A1K1PD79_9FLAO|nr:OmpA family protein [Cellulophaga fucicola]SFW45532.1 WD40-like Beta Propeller Repeat [Cellulophaga fucicola]